MTDQDCSHPAEHLSKGVVDPTSRYCAACSSLIFPDGRVEAVKITGMRVTRGRSK